MNLTRHQFDHKPSRYYIDGKRVTPDDYDHTITKARIAGRQHCCFITRSYKARNGSLHYVHHSVISAR